MPAQEATPDVKLEHRVVVPEHVVTRGFGDETVILDVESGRYHGLNYTGGVMFDALGDAPSIGVAAEALAVRLPAPAERVQADLLTLCAELVARGLISVEDA